ncbi:MAG: DNA processing protein [Rickettsiales bacterium]|jgi:DNA processing protein
MPHSTNHNQETINWLRLIRTPNVGRSTFFHLLEVFGSAQKAIENIGEYSRKVGKVKPIIVGSEKDAQKELELSAKNGAEILLFKDPKYPQLLREIPDSPPLISVRGDISLLKRNIIGIVGPRNPSLNGCKFARKIAGDLGERGFVVASGVARGIDAAAHFGSLDSGTIGVIGGGIDNIYPFENKALYHQIYQKGLIVSEFAFGSKPNARNFPQRNRIISGLSLGIVVVEATLKSGTLITARCALEQNREVFSVPGSPFDPRCQGANRLIKQGATLIENVDDITNELTIFEEFTDAQFPQMDLKEDSDSAIKSSDDGEGADVMEMILAKVNHSQISINEIITELQIPTRLVNVALLQLELVGRIENKNGKICLVSDQ